MGQKIRTNYSKKQEMEISGQVSIYDETLLSKQRRLALIMTSAKKIMQFCIIMAANLPNTRLNTSVVLHCCNSWSHIIQLKKSLQYFSEDIQYINHWWEPSPKVTLVWVKRKKKNLIFCPQHHHLIDAPERLQQLKKIILHKKGKKGANFRIYRCN